MFIPEEDHKKESVPTHTLPMLPFRSIYTKMENQIKNQSQWNWSKRKVLSRTSLEYSNSTRYGSITRRVLNISRKISILSRINLFCMCRKVRNSTLQVAMLNISCFSCWARVVMVKFFWPSISRQEKNMQSKSSKLRTSVQSTILILSSWKLRYWNHSNTKI